MQDAAVVVPTLTNAKQKMPSYPNGASMTPTTYFPELYMSNKDLSLGFKKDETHRTPTQSEIPKFTGTQTRQQTFQLYYQHNLI